MSVAEEEKQLVREKPKSKRLAFVLLGIAIVAEVTGAICLKASEGLTVPLPNVPKKPCASGEQWYPALTAISFSARNAAVFSLLIFLILNEIKGTL